MRIDRLRDVIDDVIAELDDGDLIDWPSYDVSKDLILEIEDAIRTSQSSYGYVDRPSVLSLIDEQFIDRFDHRTIQDSLPPVQFEAHASLSSAPDRARGPSSTIGAQSYLQIQSVETYQEIENTSTASLSSQSSIQASGEIS